ncbi:FtsX-like permease family protein [Candidatus Poribacteria bacterium]|nr:FtsX-like permease family protein [Candidatus Poribacteria bacterium]
MRRSAAFKMLFHDRATAFGSIAGVIAIIFLVGQQLGIFFGLLNYMSVLVDNSGADIWLKARNADNINSAGTIPISYRDRIMGLQGVQWVEPIVIGVGLLKLQEGNYQAVQIFGTRRPRLAGGPNQFYQGSITGLLDEEGVTLDRLDLATLDYPSIGAIFELNGKRVRVRGITQNMQGFSGSLLYTNLAKARELVNMDAERCSNLLIKVNDGVDINAMVVLLQQILPKADAVYSKKLSSQTKLYYLKNTGIGSSFGFTTLVGALIGVVIIALTMYTNVLNKTRDYAVLRALGARRRDVLYIVFMQSMYIALIGLLAGFTLLSLFLILAKNTGLPSYMPWWAALLHAVVTLFLCLLGSLIAMRRAIRIEPATAFR